MFIALDMYNDDPVHPSDMGEDDVFMVSYSDKEVFW